MIVRRIHTFLCLVLFCSFIKELQSARFKNPQRLYQVYENLPIGSHLFTLEATGSPGDNIRILYGMDGGTTESLVTINQTVAGQDAKADISLKAMLDRDIDNHTVTLYILDVNDYTPTFDKPSYQFNVPENENLSSTVFSNITTKDLDNGMNATFNYFLVPAGQSSDSYKGVFSISGRFISGGHKAADIILSKHLDYEKLTFYQYTIKAIDEGTPAQTGTADLIIKVTDEQDSPPVFLELPYLADINEDLQFGSFVLKVSAEDGDRGVPNPIQYHFVEGQCNKFFSLNPTSGDITVNQSLDSDSGVIKDMNGVCKLLVNASEIQTNHTGGRTWTNTTVTITIKDIDDNTPTFVNGPVYEATVYETLIGVPITILNYTGIRIIDNDQLTDYNTFDISVEYLNATEYTMLTPMPSTITSDGVVRLQLNSQPYDYETTKNVTFMVLATEQKNNSHSSSCLVHLTILDMNDNSPKFDHASYETWIDEGSPNSTKVIALTATDADSGAFGNVSYRLLSGEDNFFIDANSGNIYTNCKPAELDFEIRNIYILTVEAADGGGRRTPATVTVHLNDVNDNSPHFISNQYEVSLDENSKHFSTEPFIVEASDRDSGNNSIRKYSLEIDEDLANNFTINATSGEIKLVGTLDYEKVNFTDLGRIVVYVVAKDMGEPSLSSNTTVIIHLRDMNDNEPKFLQHIYTANITEGKNQNRNVTQVKAVDMDASNPNNETRYYIEQGGLDRFFIDSKTGIITTSSWNFNRETLDNYSLSIIARDLGNPPKTGSTSVVISVDDVNDEKPVFGKNSYLEDVMENATIGSLVITFDATDKDENDELVYSVIQAIGHTESGAVVSSSDIENYFGIYENNGTVFVKSILDRETAPMVLLIISVNDTNGVINIPQTATATLTIHLLDVNDNAPKFTRPIYTTSIRESSAVEAIVTTVTATDADVNNRITYSIYKNPKKGFNIGNESGIITVRNSSSLDREADAQMNITVMACDGINNSTAVVIVNLTDINDNTPTFLDHNTIFVLPEQKYNNTVVGRFNATDNDIGLNADITYFINGNQHTLFHIDRYTGDLIIDGDLDREKISDNPSYIFTLLAKDNPDDKSSQKTGTTTVLITISDINDNAPQFDQSDYKISLSEKATTGRTVVTMEAKDPDKGNNGTVRYHMIGMNASDWFEIDNTTGVITVSVPLIDKVGNYSFNVTAEDMGDPPLSNSTTVWIMVLDENNHAPVFTKPFYESSVFECARIGTYVLSVTATDADIDYKNKNVTYQFDNSSAVTIKNFFLIDKDTGAITVAKKLNAKETDLYRLKINASDGGDPKMSSLSGDVVIKIKDVNDQPPAFNKPLYNASVKEEIDRAYVTTVVATDPDSESNTTYSLVGNLNSTNFEIHKLTGEIYLTKKMDRENVSEVTLTVHAKDSTLATNYSSQCDKPSQNEFNATVTNVRVTIIDINDNPPEFQAKQLSVGVRRDVKEGVVIYDFKKHVNDRDIGENGVHTFKLLGSLNATDNLKNQIPKVVNECPGSKQKTALCVSGNGTVSVNVLFLANAMGIISMRVLAEDSAGNDSAQLNVILVADSQTLQMMFFKTKDEVAKISAEVMKKLNESLPFYEFIQHDIQPYTENGKRDDYRTNLLFHVQEQKSKRILSAEEAKRFFERPLIKKLFEGQKSELQNANLGDPDDQIKRIYVLVAVIVLLSGVIFILGYFLYSSIGKYKRRLKAATINTVDKEDAKDLTFVPGSNEFAEKKNPLLNVEIKQTEIPPDDTDSQNSLDMNEVDYANRHVPLSDTEEKEKIMEMYGDDFYVPDDNVDPLQLALEEHNRQLTENYKNELLRNADTSDIDLGLDNPIIYKQLETTEV